MPITRTVTINQTSGGGTGGTADFSGIVRAAETPNGTRTTFTLPSAYVTGSIGVFLNGQLLDRSDYTQSSSTTITFLNAPYADDNLQFLYRLAG